MDVDSPLCECTERQTAKHLFVYCPRLAKARSFLHHKLGHTNFDSMMGREHDAAIAADWAICFFPFDQYDWTRRNTDNTFTHDMVSIQLNQHNPNGMFPISCEQYRIEMLEQWENFRFF